MRHRTEGAGQPAIVRSRLIDTIAVLAPFSFWEVRSMGDDPNDAQILSQERRCIELLAREAHTATATVQHVFLSEYKRLAAAAHVKAFLPLLTRSSVREILRSARRASAL